MGAPGAPAGGPPMPGQQPQQPPQMHPDDFLPDEQEDPSESADEKRAAELDRLLVSTNIVDELDEDERNKLAQVVIKGWELDKVSRKPWEEGYEGWLKMAGQYREHKNFPWQGASNVKFPLLSTAAMQFNARAYPTLIPSSGDVVRMKVKGKDVDGSKSAMAVAVAQVMSEQVMEEMHGWEEDMDKLLLILPISGTCFKKTYYDEFSKKVCSYLVHGMDLVVNHWTKNLCDASRVTQEYRWTRRELKEKMATGSFRKIDLPDSVLDLAKREVDGVNMTTPTSIPDEATPYLCLEQHTWYDVDGDGYAEPVVITVLAQQKEVLQILPRWYSEDVITDEKERIVKIKPINYFTKYGFIPNPDGGFYDLGWGQLLGPLNEAVNTLVNQLVDAGSLSNLQSGFLAKGLRIKVGDNKFTPGEWKPVNAMGEDLQKSIFPLPVREPSNVLFQLFGALVQSVKELASVAEIFTGKMPGQNTPAYTVKETVDQGQKVFTAIYKRVYRSMTEEFRKIYKMNYLFCDDDQLKSLFSESEEYIVPAADPQAETSATKIELLPDPNTPPPPPPEVQKMQMQAKMDQQKLQAEMQMKQQEHEMKMKELQAELEFQKQIFQLKLEEARMGMQVAQAKLGIDAQRAKMDMVTGAMDHQQSMAQSDQTHQQKMTHQEEANAAKSKQAGVSGVVGKSSKRPTNG